MLQNPEATAMPGVHCVCVQGDVADEESGEELGGGLWGGGGLDRMVGV